MDIIVRNGSLREKRCEHDIGIEGGEIRTVDQQIDSSAPIELDADSGLVLPSFVDPHTHLDIAFLDEIGDPPDQATLPELLAFTREIKQDQTVEEVKTRMERAVRAAVANGTTTIRTNLDVGPTWGLTSVEAALELKEELADIVDIQTIAMPFALIGAEKEKGLTEEDVERIRQAVEMGVDAIGGEPKRGAIDQLECEAVDRYFELAEEYDAELDFHTDGMNSQTARATEYLARKTIEEEFQDRVHISHVSALSQYDQWHRRDVIDLLARADLNVVTNPKEDQLVADHDTTAVSELLDAGVTVSIGHNDIAVPISPYGGLDLVQHAWLLAHVTGMRSPSDRQRLVEMITHNPAEALGIEHYGVEPGCDADLVVCREETVSELLRTRKPRAAVLKNGSVVATTSMATSVGVDTATNR